MKKKFLLLVCVSVSFYNLKAQMVLSSGNNFVQTGGYVVLQDASLVNNGTFNPPAGTVRFSGTGNNSISGTTSPAFQILEISKSSGSQLTLQNNITVNNNINFLSGLIELNANNIDLTGTAYLNNESETSRITGITGGYVQATATLNAPSAENPGNLGVVITSAQNPGVTVIRRGHVSQQNSYGTGNSIYRYYDILPATPPSSLTVRLNYFDAELNGLQSPLLADQPRNGQQFVRGLESERCRIDHAAQFSGLQGLGPGSNGGDFPALGTDRRAVGNAGLLRALEKHAISHLVADRPCTEPEQVVVAGILPGFAERRAPHATKAVHRRDHHCRTKKKASGPHLSGHVRVPDREQPE